MLRDCIALHLLLNHFVFKGNKLPSTMLKSLQQDSARLASSTGNSKGIPKSFWLRSNRHVFSVCKLKISSVATMSQVSLIILTVYFLSVRRYYIRQWISSNFKNQFGPYFINHLSFNKVVRKSWTFHFSGIHILKLD